MKLTHIVGPVIAELLKTLSVTLIFFQGHGTEPKEMHHMSKKLINYHTHSDETWQPGGT